MPKNDSKKAIPLEAEDSVAAVYPATPKPCEGG